MQALELGGDENVRALFGLNLVRRPPLLPRPRTLLTARSRRLQCLKASKIENKKLSDWCRDRVLAVYKRKAPSKEKIVEALLQ